MKRILFVINQFYKGGAESSLLNFIRLLVQCEHEVSLVVYNHQEERCAVSLIDELPASVRLCIGRSGSDGLAVKDFISSMRYDFAVSIGEWHSPEFVIRYANARKRGIWIHADVTSLAIPKTPDLFDYDRSTDVWICVSSRQCQIMKENAPFLTGEFKTVHNAIDFRAIKAASMVEVDLPPECEGRKVIVMTGNLRPAKNYLRAVKVASMLKAHGGDAVWLVCGNLADRSYVSQVRKCIRKFGLERDFLLLGGQENPWKYMARADVFMSTSDTESWCMAVTEALALGIPVVSTPTDGVKEQISQGVNGYVCGFDDTSLVDGLDKIFRGELSNRRNLKSVLFDPVGEFLSILDAPCRTVEKAEAVVVIDDANYRGGAHIATMRMLKKLRERGIICDVFSGIRPTFETRMKFAPLHIVHIDLDWFTRYYYEIGALDFVRLPGVSLAIKMKKVFMALRSRMSSKSDHKIMEQVSNRSVERILSKYRTVMVMSEASKFRNLVSRLPEHIRKIQLIHTFYSLWRNFTFWTKEITCGDGLLYSRFDQVALIGKRNADEFISLYPKLEGKACAFHNVIEVENGRCVKSGGKAVRLVTVTRLESEKDIPRMIRIASRLKASGVDFVWNVFGDGSFRDDAERNCRKYGLSGVFNIRGYDKHPTDRMRESDLFVILSHYEGLPNVIYESLCVGTPVFSTDVGGISEQIVDNENGRLVPDDEEKIFETLFSTLCNPETIVRWRGNLRGYRYDNESAVDSFLSLIRP
jgi:glycosyltransferase involved in cell wall biosynthesis